MGLAGVGSFRQGNGVVAMASGMHEHFHTLPYVLLITNVYSNFTF